MRTPDFLSARLFVLLFAIALIASLPAHAQPSVQVLLDLDNDPGTGCLVATADGPFDGIDGILTVGVDPGASTVGPSSLEECQGGIFGAAQPIDAASWPLGESLGEGGSDLTEFRYPLTALDHGTQIRVAFLSCMEEDALACLQHTSSSDALLTTTGQPGGTTLLVDLRSAVEIPTVGELGLWLLTCLLVICCLAVLRRQGTVSHGLLTLVLVLSIGSGVLWAAVLLDGQPDDWFSVPLFASDPEGDSPSLDLIAAFAKVEGTNLFFRLDAQIDAPPTAVADSAVVQEDDLPVAIDVLANDLDPDGGPITIDSIVQPSAGTVVLTGEGSGLTYEPDPDACNDGAPTDDFTYTLAPGGAAATVRVEVTCVNDPPSFVTAGDLVVDMNAGTNSGVNQLVGWASAIQPGPPNEAGQAVSFLVNNSNPDLFTIQPFLSPNGDLTFTTAHRAVGSATLTVVAADDGGTTNGGDDTSGAANSTLDVSCTVTPPEDFFSGPFLMEQLSGADPFYASETFGDTQVVDIIANGFERSFDFVYFPGIFDSDYNFTMYLCGGETTVVGSINAGGLGCGGANIGFATGSPAATYDPDFSPTSDDITLVDVADFDPDGNCDTGSYPVELRFTEQ